MLSEDGEARRGALMEGGVVIAMELGLQACLICPGKYRPGDEARAPQARCGQAWPSWSMRC